MGYALVITCLLTALPAVAGESDDAKETTMMMQQSSAGEEHTGQTDFDFFMGRWKVRNRRLRERLKGSTAWDEFDSTVVARHAWGGKANVDEYEADAPSGHIQGLTLRLFNPRTRQWSLYWANSANGTMEVPVVGEFKDGRGEFYNQEMFEGRSIYVRFLWSDITPASCRWEQAFSADGGKTWEINWVMEFTRMQ